jgi:hypothetical protein
MSEIFTHRSSFEQENKKSIQGSPLDKKAKQIERRDHINLEADFKKLGKSEQKGKNRSKQK